MKPKFKIGDKVIVPVWRKDAGVGTIHGIADILTDDNLPYLVKFEDLSGTFFNENEIGLDPLYLSPLMKALRD